MMLMWLLPFFLILLFVGGGPMGHWGHSHHDHHGGGDALEILRMRLSRGEITPEEFDRLRTKLQTP